MAQLTLRDLATNEEIIVPPEGFVFGRTGGDADIQIEDNSISRRQARVSNRQGTWVLEVMVVPPGQRLPRPQSLQEGQTFFIGQSEFEVLQLAEGEDDEPAKTLAPSRGKPGPAPAAAAPAKRATATPAANGKSAPPPAKKPAAAKPAARAAAPVDDEAPPDDEAPVEGGKQGIAALFVGVPKGIAYYMVNVPKLLFNPLGTVRSTIADQPNPALGRTGLIGYALPAQLATALLGSIASGIAILIGGGGFSIMSFIPIVPAIIAVITSVVIGFVYHPVLNWIINFLKGESDEKSRSNYFLQMNTLSIVLAVPNALGLILASIRIPFINLLGPLLMTVASLVSIFVVYQWFVFFKVVDWFRKVILVLGALSVVFAAIGLVTGLIASVRSLGSGSSSSSSSAAADIDEATKQAEAAADEAMKNMNAEQKEAMQKARAQAKAAMEVAAKGGKAAQAAQEAAMKQVKEAQEAADKAAEDATKTVAAATKEAKEPKEDKHPAAARDPEPAAENSGGNDEPAAAPSGAFGSYAHKREAIEKRLENDPTVLAADTDLQKLYGNYVEAVFKIDQEYMRKISKDSEHTKLYEHLKNAELYKKTGGMVDKLSNKLNVK